LGKSFHLRAFSSILYPFFINLSRKIWILLLFYAIFALTNTPERCIIVYKKKNKEEN